MSKCIYEQVHKRQVSSIYNTGIIKEGVRENVNTKKLHLIKWNTLLLPKKNGGLGMKEISLQIQALLFKWLWRFENHRDSL